MGLSETPEQMAYYPTLTREEKARMHPCRRAKCVMMSADSSPTLQASSSTNHYPELPDEPRPGKIRPSTPQTANTSTGTSSIASGSSPTHSNNENSNRSNSNNNNNNNNNGTAGSNNAESRAEVEAIEEAVPIVRSTLPSPEPRPPVERNGYKSALHSSREELNDKVDGDIKFKQTTRRDIDEDSCLIKCVYFTQQCCECTII